jgi:hypothetical protein
MRRQTYLGLIILNILVTLATGAALIAAYTRFAPAATPPRVAPIQVIITATPDPNLTVEVRYLVVTATAGPATLLPLTPNLTAAAIGILPSPPPIATLDPELLPTLPTNTPTIRPPTATDLPPTLTPTGEGGCPVYIVKRGDVPGSIATEYGITLAELYKANKLKTDPVLQIGQRLIIPTSGCALAVDTATPIPTETLTPTPIPTSTAVPTASKVVIQVTGVVKPGDITEEGVTLVNVSNSIVELKDWKLRNAQGEEFVFGNYRLFPNGRVLVSTRSGTNTPILLFWGKSTAQWSGTGQVVTLLDSRGVIQATYSVGN